MKTILLVILLSFCSVLAFSQSSGEYTYSLGVRGYNYQQMPKLFNQINTDHYLTSYFNSYIVKFNDNLWSYRLNGSHIKKNDRFVNTCANCETIDGEIKDISFKMGFEKNFNYAVIQPYFAFDIGYRSNKFDGYAITNNAEVLAINENQQQNQVKSTKDGFTITPSFGLKINPIKQISIFAESNMEWFYSSATEERIIQDASNTINTNKYKKGEFLFNPITVGVQIHIGNNY